MSVLRTRPAPSKVSASTVREIAPACPICGGPMQPSYSSNFCPRDCDRKPAAKYVGWSPLELLQKSAWHAVHRPTGTMTGLVVNRYYMTDTSDPWCAIEVNLVPMQIWPRHTPLGQLGYDQIVASDPVTRQAHWTLTLSSPLYLVSGSSVGFTIQATRA